MGGKEGRGGLGGGRPRGDPLKIPETATRKKHSLEFWKGERRGKGGGLAGGGRKGGGGSGLEGGGLGEILPKSLRRQCRSKSVRNTFS